MQPVIGYKIPKTPQKIYNKCKQPFNQKQSAIKYKFTAQFVGNKFKFMHIKTNKTTDTSSKLL